jgi:glycosyltransferase involved in cell wall biosynthesis
MRTNLGRTLTVFFTFGMSLEEWARAGLLTREVKLYRKLQRDGMNVQLVTYGDSKDRQWETELDGVSVIPVYEHFSRPQTILGELVKSFFIPWAIKKHLSRSDLFKTNQMMGAWVAVIAKLRYRKPLLLRCGFEMSEFFRLAGVSCWQKCAGWLLSLVSYFFADQIHVATMADKALVRRKFRVQPEKIKVWPNWVDTREFSPPSISEEGRNGVLFVGRLSDQKNLFLLLDAIAGTGQLLTVVGDGECAAAIQDRARTLNVYVEFHGSIANNLLPALYRRCAVYVICSRYEGHPKTLLEAMACGCAVVGTDVPGIREIIDDKKNGILVEPNPACLRKAIVDLHDDPNLCQDLGNAARNTALQKYDLNTAVEAEWHAYNTLMGIRQN